MRQGHYISKKWARHKTRKWIIKQAGKYVCNITQRGFGIYAS